MSDSDRPSSLSGNKRAASSTTAVEEMHAQRMRLADAAAADPPAATLSPLSAAQRCADDPLTIVFGFIELKELASAARTCRAWLAAAVKEKPRGLIRSFDQADRLAALCTSCSPFKKHISRVTCNHSSSLSLSQLSQLNQLPELTGLKVQVNATDLTRLMGGEVGGALAELQTAFPPKLRDLTLRVSEAHSRAMCQLLLDALPALKGLQKLALALPVNVQLSQTAALSLEPLLQLPCLTHLTLDIGELTVPQLHTIKHIATLQNLFHGMGRWTAALLSAFCRPPHRLQQLEAVQMWETTVDEAAMTELMSLPALTAIESFRLMPSAYAFLPRFPRLQRLLVPLHHVHPVHQAEHNALLASALSACPALTALTLSECDCSESCGSQLMQAVPRLRSLAFEVCSLPSLRFLGHAPNLKELSLLECTDVRPGHVTGIGSFAPQLEFLRVHCCAGLQLDEAEQRLLTPPGALGLPHLRVFDYRKSSI